MSNIGISLLHTINTNIMTLTKKQIKAIEKAEKLIIQAQTIFNDANLGKYWCPIYGQTESSLNRASECIKGYANYKLNN